MLTALFLLALSSSLSGSPASLASAAQGADDPRVIACYALDTRNKPWTKPLWNGYQVSLGPAADTADNPEAACTAALTDREGNIVFRTVGFGTRLDEATGMDLDGDGSPDVVLVTDTAGGNSCCWEIAAVSLAPKPHELFRYQPAGAFSFRKDSAGHVVLWSTEGGMLAMGYSMAERPFAQMLFRFIDGNLVNVTPDYRNEIFNDQRFGPRGPQIPALELSRFRSIGKIAGDDWETALAVFETALQYAYCRDLEKAHELIRDDWPAFDQQRALDVLDAEFRRVWPAPQSAPAPHPASGH